MSNEVALALVAASSFPGFFCHMYSSRMANPVATEIVTGLVGGVPVPAEWRERPSIGVAFLVAAINLKIATATVDPGVQTLAYLFVFGFGLTVVGWVLSGAAEFAYFRRVPQQAIRERPNSKGTASEEVVRTSAPSTWYPRDHVYPVS